MEFEKGFQFTLMVLMVACLAVAWAEDGAPQRGLIHHIRRGVAGPNPYIFLTAPRGRSQALIQGFEVIDEDEIAPGESEELDGEDDNEDTANEESDHFEDHQQLTDAQKDNENDELSQSKTTSPIKPIMVSREHAGAIMVPDQIIEIEAQSLIDEKTGKAALLLPRSVMDSIPDGSVVALMQRRSIDEGGEEEREKHIAVRYQRNRLGNGGNKRFRVLKRAGNKRPNNYSRKNARVLYRGIRPGSQKRHLNHRHFSH